MLTQCHSHLLLSITEPSPLQLPSARQSLERRLSDPTTAMLSLQKQRVLEERVGQLEARVAALEAGHHPSASVSSRPSTRRSTLQELVTRSVGVHPSKKAKKEKKKDNDMLKTPLNGLCLTEPQLIQALEEQEVKQKEKDDAKEKRKEEAQAAAKQRREEKKAATKKRKAEKKVAQKEEAKRRKVSVVSG
jgi:hypothetical protein